MRMPRAILALTCAAAIAGCGQQSLRALQPPGQGPDEFAVLPVQPLTEPQDYAFLPAPTLGGTNLTDPNPKAEAVAALGGNPAALNPNAAIPSSDAALVTASSRYGVPENTREVVNAEDAEFLKRRARWSRLRLFPVDRYAEIYDRQAIDPQAQTSVLRAQGVETPSSPPE